MNIVRRGPAKSLHKHVQIWKERVARGTVELAVEKATRNLKELSDSDFEILATIAAVENCDLEIAFIALGEFLRENTHLEE